MAKKSARKPSAARVSKQRLQAEFSQGLKRAESAIRAASRAAKADLNLDVKHLDKVRKRIAEVKMLCFRPFSRPGKHRHRG